MMAEYRQLSAASATTVNFCAREPGGDVGKPYDGEIQLLDKTLTWASAADLTPLVSAVRHSWQLPLIAIGSGGSLTAAHVLVGAHRRYACQSAYVMTPLEYQQEGSPKRASVWLFSAGGSNPDILATFASVLEQEPAHAAIVCGQSRSPLTRSAIDREWIDVAATDLATGRDGFLATNSLVATCALIARSYSAVLGSEWSAALPSNRVVESWRRRVQPLWSRSTVQVLYSAASKAGAIDIESKFTEAALGNVQLADYRNFAHGRHHWLAKHGKTTAVLAFSSPADELLADRTLRLLPRSVPVAYISLQGDYFSVALSSVIAALHCAGWAGHARSIDPGRPGVPAFGRQLYRLRSSSRRSKRPLPKWTQSAVERKAASPIAELERSGSLARWVGDLRTFCGRLREAVIQGVVLDYDGTLVDVRERFSPPVTDIAQQLLRLLDAGLALGIATGRGASIGRDLRCVLPPATWSLVTVGYYNGAEIARLSEEGAPVRSESTGPLLRSVAEALRNDPELSAIAEQEDRLQQIKLEPRPRAPLERVWRIVNHIVRAAGQGGVQAVSSGHSIDILAPGVSKVRVIEGVIADVLARDGANGRNVSVLTIGDRGCWPGNDYELLRAPYSLSVDEVSADPLTCWNLAAPGTRGRKVTLQYLKALRTTETSAHFHWPPRRDP
jgi:hydroxymethylpyrimidine pyrophosphatase-like HAD family hydrolase/fructoselysine-6-P-deglycase FrlB-like protein